MLWVEASCVLEVSLALDLGPYWDQVCTGVCLCCPFKHRAEGQEGAELMALEFISFWVLSIVLTYVLCMASLIWHPQLLRGKVENQEVAFKPLCYPFASHCHPLPLPPPAVPPLCFCSIWCHQLYPVCGSLLTWPPPDPLPTALIFSLAALTP